MSLGNPLKSTVNPACLWGLSHSTWCVPTSIRSDGASQPGDCVRSNAGQNLWGQHDQHGQSHAGSVQDSWEPHPATRLVLHWRRWWRPHRTWPFFFYLLLLLLSFFRLTYLRCFLFCSSSNRVVPRRPRLSRKARCILSLCPISTTCSPTSGGPQLHRAKSQVSPRELSLRSSSDHSKHRLAWLQHDIPLLLFQ